MSGWVHTEKLSDELPVAVNPTPTTLWSGSVLAAERVSGFVENTDGAQTLAVTAEASWDGATKWVGLDAINGTQFASALVAGERRLFIVDVTDLRFIRLRGAASGAGLNAIVSVQRTSILPVR